MIRTAQVGLPGSGIRTLGALGTPIIPIFNRNIKVYCILDKVFVWERGKLFEYKISCGRKSKLINRDQNIFQWFFLFCFLT